MTVKHYVCKAVEVSAITIASTFLTYTAADIPYNTRPLILLATIMFIGYMQFMSTKLWTRIAYPLSLMSLGLLISRMVYGTIPNRYYIYVVLAYIVTAFLLYHALYRIITVFLGERKGLFHIVLEDIELDMIIYLVAITILTIWVYHLGAIQWWAGSLVIVSTWSLWFFVSRYMNKRVFSILLEGRVSPWGFTHPIEPEAEKTLLSIASLIVLVSLMIPLLFAYTHPLLVQRGFVPLALLGVFQAITCLLYLVAYVLIMHGAFVEEIARTDKRQVDIEGYKVFGGWRDISWFLNRSAGYYYRLKYLSALYMLFQGLEILSKRTGDKEIYYGDLYNVLRNGYKYILINKLLRYVDKQSLEKTLDAFKPENIWVIEADTSVLEKEPEETREFYKWIFSSTINLYAKLVDVPHEASSEWRKAIELTVNRLDHFIKTRIRDIGERASLEKIRVKLLDLLNKDHVEQSDLETILRRYSPTINMIRNYLVHGQLVKNAIVYRGSRDEFDRIMSQPYILYSLYTLIIAYTISRHPELLRRR